MFKDFENKVSLKFKALALSKISCWISYLHLPYFWKFIPSLLKTKCYFYHLPMFFQGCHDAPAQISCHLTCDGAEVWSASGRECQSNRIGDRQRKTDDEKEREWERDWMCVRVLNSQGVFWILVHNTKTGFRGTRLVACLLSTVLLSSPSLLWQPVAHSILPERRQHSHLTCLPFTHPTAHTNNK